MTTISLESFVAPKLPWVKTPIRAKVIESNEFFLCEKKKKKKKRSKVTRTLSRGMCLSEPCVFEAM